MTIKILALLLGIACGSYAKDIKGFYITPQQDTVQAIFEVKWGLTRPNLYRLQAEVTCTDSSGVKKTLHPQDTESFMLFMPDGKNIKFSSFTWTNEKGNPQLFALDFGGSYVHLYAYIVLNSYDKSETQRFMLKKQGQETIEEVWGFSTRKQLMAYFADCPVLVQQIEKREPIAQSMVEMVGYYNTHCAPQLQNNK